TSSINFIGTTLPALETGSSRIRSNIKDIHMRSSSWFTKRQSEKVEHF
ncbi:22901_t:CDS:2, partial [Racocetra persica]